MILAGLSHGGWENPVRIVCDTHLRTPPQAQVVMTAAKIPTILATCCADQNRYAAYMRAGCRVLCLNCKGGHVDLLQLMEQLGQEQIDSILLEGGGTLNWAALKAGSFNRCRHISRPRCCGTESGRNACEGTGVPTPDASFHLKNSRLFKLGEDFLIESEVDYPCSPGSLKKSER